VRTTICDLHQTTLHSRRQKSSCEALTRIDQRRRDDRTRSGTTLPRSPGRIRTLELKAINVITNALNHRHAAWMSRPSAHQWEACSAESKLLSGLWPEGERHHLTEGRQPFLGVDGRDRTSAHDDHLAEAQLNSKMIQDLAEVVLVADSATLCAGNVR